MSTFSLFLKGLSSILLYLLGAEGLSGEAEAGYFSAVSWAGGFEELVAEAEVAVWGAPADLVGQGIEHPEDVFARLTEDHDLPLLLAEIRVEG